MELNVSSLLKSPVGTTRAYDLDIGARLPLDDETTAVIDGGHLRLDRTNTAILARGHADATVGVVCGRCLDPVAQRVAIEFAEEFEPSVDVSSGKALPASENDMAFTISPNHILDLSEALRQNLIGALPIQSLCRPDCAGLCPVCGANRNTTFCGCIVSDENHPFVVLADLLRESV